MKRIVLVALCLFSFSFCQKEGCPRAVIYVLNEQMEPLPDCEVRFLAFESEKNKNAFDTTVYTASNGQAVLETAYDMYLDVVVLYKKQENNTIAVVANTMACLSSGKVYIDTLIIKQK